MVNTNSRLLEMLRVNGDSVLHNKHDVYVLSARGQGAEEKEDGELKDKGEGSEEMASSGHDTTIATTSSQYLCFLSLGLHKMAPVTSQLWVGTSSPAPAFSAKLLAADGCWERGGLYCICVPTDGPNQARTGPLPHRHRWLNLVSHKKQSEKAGIWEVNLQGGGAC